MQNPSALILFSAMPELQSSKISDLFEERHREFPCVATPGSNSIVLSMAGALVAIMALDMRLPDGWQPIASRAKLYWPESEAVFNGHGAHIRISVIGEGESSSRLQIARVVTAVAGAVVVSHSSCSAVLWDWVVASPAEMFAERSHSAFAPYPNFPSALWVSTQPFRDLGSSCVGVVTQGLSNFINREVELEGSAAQLKAVLTTARGLIEYLLQDGVTVQDGDTFGSSAEERIRLSFQESRNFQGLPVMVASLPDLE
jgi:Domain of unknown function (DUF4261)